MGLPVRLSHRLCCQLAPPRQSFGAEPNNLLACMSISPILLRWLIIM